MKQILIVEDDSFLNKIVAYNLTADGYGVTSALNARTAADAIRQREFDLVLLDINLPDVNGLELCKLIKPQHPDTIVIFLTANDQESDQIRGYEVGAVDYITKPFVIGALQRKIKAMFAMLEHHKPAKDIYDDGRLFLDFSEQTASLNGKPLTLSPMEGIHRTQKQQRAGLRPRNTKRPPGRKGDQPHQRGGQSEAVEQDRRGGHTSYVQWLRILEDPKALVCDPDAVPPHG